MNSVRVSTYICTCMQSCVRILCNSCNTGMGALLYIYTQNINPLHIEVMQHLLLHFIRSYFKIVTKM